MNENKTNGEELGGLENKKAVSSLDFVWASFVPTTISKIFVLYFGINYANYPGEGYGIGLAIAILFTLFTLGRFVWKYRNYQD